MPQKIHKGISPLSIPENEKIVSIAFPSEASSITSLDIPETATIDVTACSRQFTSKVRLEYTTNNINAKYPNMNEIYYTTRNNDVVNLASSEYPSNELFGTVQSNTYENNKGVILFRGNAKLSHHMFDNLGTDDEQYNEIKSVILPDSVTEIPQSAFQGCSNLQSIDFGNVTSIGKSAFNGCKGLTSITIPSSVTSISSRAFYGCSGLTSVSLGNGVTSIGQEAFRGCSGLTSVSLGNGVTSIGQEAFRSCSGLTSITIPDSVNSIGNNAFWGCSGLTSFNVSENNTKYDSRNNCNALIETATNTLISGCQNTIIPDSVTSIGGGAFLSCSSLTSITIPNGVTSIGNGAFNFCSGLTSITFKGTTAQWNAISKGINWKNGVPTTCQVICTDGTISI